MIDCYNTMLPVSEKLDMHTGHAKGQGRSRHCAALHRIRGSLGIPCGRQVDSKGMVNDTVASSASVLINGCSLAHFCSLADEPTVSLVSVCLCLCPSVCLSQEMAGCTGVSHSLNLADWLKVPHLCMYVACLSVCLCV